MKMARCIIELERIYGIKNGGKGSNQHSKKEEEQDNLIPPKTQLNLANQLEISRQQLSDYKKLTTLIPELQELIEDGELKATTGYKKR